MYTPSSRKVVHVNPEIYSFLFENFIHSPNFISGNGTAVLEQRGKEQNGVAHGVENKGRKEGV